MSRNRTKRQMYQFQLPGHDEEWLEAQDFSHFPSKDRHQAVAFLNEQMGIPYKAGAVFRAYNAGDIPTSLVSGRACASEYDIARWTLARKYTSRERDRARFGASAWTFHSKDTL